MLSGQLADVVPSHDQRIFDGELGEASVVVDTGLSRGRVARFINDLGVTRAAYRVFAGRLFHRYFHVVAALSDELRTEVYRIRYDVYCDELRFEDPGKFPDRLERDQYDRQSLHCLLLHRPTNVFAGCVRLVQVEPEHPSAPLPFERVCAGKLYPEVIARLAPDRLKTAEISRLAVRSNFRRRKGESNSPAGVVEEKMGPLGKMRTPWIALGLYLSAAAMGLLRGLDGVYALMEPRLARRLRTYGICFVQVGDSVSHRGERAPFFISREALYEGMPLIIRGLLDVVTDDLLKTGASAIAVKR